MVQTIHGMDDFYFITTSTRDLNTHTFKVYKLSEMFFVNGISIPSANRAKVKADYY